MTLISALIQDSLMLGKPKGSGVTYQLHRTTLNAAAVKEAGQLLWRKIAHLNPDFLVAPGLGAAPIAAAIGQAALADGIQLQTLAVRDPAKSRKGERLVEGCAPIDAQTARCIFVDDTITAGGTFRQTTATLAQFGVAAQWIGIALLLDAWHPYGSRQLDASGIPVFCAVRRHDLGLTRDAILPQGHEAALAPVPAPFNIEAPNWIRYGLLSKPEHPRKAIPFIHQDMVIVATDECELMALDLASGDQIWSLEALAPRSKGCGNELRVTNDGYILVSFYDGTASKVNATTGEVAWSYALAQAIHSAPVHHSDEGKEVVFVSSEDRIEGQPSGRLICLDYAGGDLLWIAELGELSPTEPAALGCWVVTAANNGMAFCFDAFYGHELWCYSLPSLARGKPLMFYNDSGLPCVVYACEAGQVICLSVLSGKLLWQSEASRAGLEHSAPIYLNGKVIITDGLMHLIALDAQTGKKAWVNRMRGAMSWRPSRIRYTGQEALLTMTHEGHVAVTLADGQKIWERKAREYAAFAGITPPAIGDGYLARLCQDGRLAVFKLDDSYV